MTTETKPDPLAWLRAEARFPARKSDGVVATETLAYVARLQAQVAELQALSVTRILIDVVPGDGSGQEVYAKSVFDVVNKLSELAELADSLQAQVDALAGALHDLLDAHARNTLFSGAGHWDVARAALAAAGR